MASKRKRVVLTLAGKIKIIEELDRGIPGKHLAQLDNVGSGFKGNKSSVIKFVSMFGNENGSASRKSNKTA